MDNDDELYSQLYGETAPAPLTYDTPPAGQHSLAGGSAPEEGKHEPTLSPGQEKLQPQLVAPESFEQLTPPAGSEAAASALETLEVDEEGDLDIQLNDQGPEGDDEDDELDITLNEVGDADKAEPSSQGESNARRYVRPGLQAPPRPTYQLPPPRPALGSAPIGLPPGTTSTAPPDQSGASVPGNVPRGPPAGPPGTGAFASNLPAVLPSQAAPGQKIRLPGQTRVTPEEYKEFLGLGHGEIFNLDIDRVTDAPWRQPGADQGDFFNYGLTARTWKDYCKQVQQFQLEFTMQKKIQVHEGTGNAHFMDPDLPPELAAAVAAERRQGFQNGGRRQPAPPPGPRPPRDGVPLRKQLQGPVGGTKATNLLQAPPPGAAADEQDATGSQSGIAAVERDKVSMPGMDGLPPFQPHQNQPRGPSQNLQGDLLHKDSETLKRQRIDPG